MCIALHKLSHLSLVFDNIGMMSQRLRQCVHGVLPPLCLLPKPAIILTLKSKPPMAQEDPSTYVGSPKFCMTPENSECVSQRTYVTKADPLETEYCIGWTEVHRQTGLGADLPELSLSPLM